jgi:heme exporter protein D
MYIYISIYYFVATLSQLVKLQQKTINEQQQQLIQQHQHQQEQEQKQQQQSQNS